MPCYAPLEAFKTASGDVVFNQLRRHGNIIQTLQLPCGQCIGCRLERSRQWAVRCMHEAALHRQNAWVTLTYNDANLPYRGMLVHEHFQKFMKRLRKRAQKTGDVSPRFYMCGEYGETTWRPHYHACLFGKQFNDQKFYKVNHQQDTIYTSNELDDLWQLGECKVAALNFHTAGYTARYICQKRTGDAAETWYLRQDEHGVYHLPPEYNAMSLKPGIGAGFMRKYTDDIYNFDYVIINGKETKPPKYYDKLLQRQHIWAYEDIKEEREANAQKWRSDNTPERLIVKQAVQQARIKSLTRTL